MATTLGMALSQGSIRTKRTFGTQQSGLYREPGVSSRQGWPLRGVPLHTMHINNFFDIAQSVGVADNIIH